MGANTSRYEHRASARTALDMARPMAYNQEDLSAVDVSHYFQGSRCPPERAEYLVQYDRFSLAGSYGEGYPSLAAILRA